MLVRADIAVGDYLNYLCKAIGNSAEPQYRVACSNVPVNLPCILKAITADFIYTVGCARIHIIRVALYQNRIVCHIPGKKQILRA